MIDPEAIHEARKFVQQTLAAVLKDSLLAVFRANIEHGPYLTDQASVGKRSLRNTCLGILTELEDDDVRELCLNQYRTAGNMTDAIAALVDLANSDWPEREELLAAFHGKWKDDALVRDKWLAIQATSRLPGTLDRVKGLLKHPVFNIKNPNKVRALIGAFASNPLRFHDLSGVGYAFVADQVLHLDPMNPQIASRLDLLEQLGTLGTGNHFIEVCVDEDHRVWLMLHSGSRGVGNRIGTDFVVLAKQEACRQSLSLPDPDLAYFTEGTRLFDEYLHAATWAQEYARVNSELMMDAMVAALEGSGQLPRFDLDGPPVNCHHNYVARESHYGRTVLVTRKGAVRAGAGDMGIIPGSMGAQSFITRGLGNPYSFTICSHGAGRATSRTAAKKAFTLEDHARATQGVECRQDQDVLDETPGAYKPIDAVMNAQRDLVEVVHTLHQVVCVKG